MLGSFGIAFGGGLEGGIGGALAGGGVVGSLGPIAAALEVGSMILGGGAFAGSTFGNSIPCFAINSNCARLLAYPGNPAVSSGGAGFLATALAPSLAKELPLPSSALTWPWTFETAMSYSWTSTATSFDLRYRFVFLSVSSTDRMN